MDRSDSGKALIYVRVSTEEQAKLGYSLDGQEEEVMQRLAQRGQAVAKVLRDEGWSGRTSDRPAYKKILEVIREDPEITHLAAWRQDRIFRNTREYLNFRARLESHGVSLIYAIGGEAEGAEGILQDQMTAVFSEYESNKGSERTILGMERARREGRIIGQAPIGLLNIRPDKGRPYVVHDPEKASFVKKSFEMIATGRYAETDVLRTLSAEGFRTRKDNPLSKQTFSRMLRNEVYTGYVPQKDGSPSVRGQFEPLISVELFNRVQAVLEGNSALCVEHVLDREEFPLRRFVRCSECDTPLTASWSTGCMGKRYGYYFCRNRDCGGVRVKKHSLEEDFSSYLLQLSPHPRLLSLLDAVVLDRWDNHISQQESYRAASEKELAEVRDYMDKLTMKYVKDHIPDDVYERQVSACRTRLQKLGRLLEERLPNRLHAESVLGKAREILRTPSSIWEDADAQRRRQLQKALFPSGVVYSTEHGVRTTLSPMGFNLLQLSHITRFEKVPLTGLELR